MRFFVILLCMIFPLMSSCVRKDTVVDGGSIQLGGKDVYWEADDFPLMVIIDDQMSKEMIDSVFYSCEIWNNAVGEVIFEPLLWNFDSSPPKLTGIVGVSVRELGRIQGKIVNGLHRGTFHPGTRHRKSSMVWFDEDLIEASYDVVMIHELGHALTLAHDPGNHRSVMHPHVASLHRSVYVMPEDADRVLKMYNGENEVDDQFDDSLPRVLELPGGLRI